MAALALVPALALICGSAMAQEKTMEKRISRADVFGMEKPFEDTAGVIGVDSG
jgi:hypothetical protein